MISLVKYPIAIKWFGDSLVESTAANNPLTERVTVKLSKSFNPYISVENYGIGGQEALEIATRLFRYPVYPGDIFGIWAGRNDVLDVGKTATSIADTIKTMTDYIKTNRYFVMSVLPATDGSEDVGSDNYNKVIALNTELSSRYGDKFIDVVSLVTNPIYHGDAFHLNAAGYNLVVPKVVENLVNRNLIPEQYIIQ